MTHGRPDWTSSINITGQDLTEVISRPKYGSAERAVFSGSIPVSSTEYLFSVTGTGMVYGGYILHEGTFDPQFICLQNVIDGEVVNYYTLESMNEWMIDRENVSLIYEKYYSEEYDKYAQGITRGITFEEGYDVKVISAAQSGASDSILAELYFALI